MENITDLCTGCTACVHVCPVKCIAMKTDDEGYLYARIDQTKCINCGTCVRTCPQNNKAKCVNGAPKRVLVIRTKNDNLLRESASGGVFATLAKAIIENGGIVYGAAYDRDLVVKHTAVDNIKDLWKLQNSKYVQSSIGDVFPIVRDQLKNGRVVLFSGTPCQVAGLKRYLRKDYPNLLTADIVCHGVPSLVLFHKYIDWISQKLNMQIGKVNFRDKADGWGLTLAFSPKSAGKKIDVIGPTDPYYENFLRGNFHRPCCYDCHYTSMYRPADITMGDYWGVEQEHRKCFSYKGVSLLMLNNEHALEFFDKYKDLFIFEESTFEKAARKNGNLRHPSTKGPLRNEVYKKMRELSPDEFFDFYLAVHQSIKSKIKTLLPSKVRLMIKIAKTCLCKL